MAYLCSQIVKQVKYLCKFHSAKRIELLVHDSTGGEGVARTPSSPQYEAVGWVGLSEGEGGARELRTASVPPRPAAYLRLRLSEPHQNDKNSFNQVRISIQLIINYKFIVINQSIVIPTNHHNRLL